MGFSYSRTISSMLVVAVVGCAGRSNDLPDDTTAGAANVSAQCDPIETRAPNASGQTPAFRGQTRICRVNSNVAHDVTVLATGLSNPWAVEPLPGGDLLVTEKPGRLRIVSPTGTIGEPISGLP